MSSGHNGMFWKYVVVDWLALAVLQWNELEKHHLKKTRINSQLFFKEIRVACFELASAQLPRAVLPFVLLSCFMNWHILSQCQEVGGESCCATAQSGSMETQKFQNLQIRDLLYCGTPQRIVWVEGGS